jgi:hypothetical protein
MKRRTTIRNAGFPLPPDCITVNLAPADLRTEGAAFELPIALGITGTGVVAGSKVGHCAAARTSPRSLSVWVQLPGVDRHKVRMPCIRCDDTAARDLRPQWTGEVVNLASSTRWLRGDRRTWARPILVTAAPRVCRAC